MPSHTKSLAFGNILFGGVIGAAVDVGSGAAYDYPSLISVQLGIRHAPAPDLADPSQPVGQSAAHEVTASGGTEPMSPTD